MLDVVFVYGSLLRGMDNHHVMDGCAFLGQAQTMARFTMLDLGSYPALVAGNTAIFGEMYAVDAQAIKRLDTFENVPDLYLRIRTLLTHGKEAWIYVYNRKEHGEDPAVTLPHVPTGDWAAWRRQR